MFTVYCRWVSKCHFGLWGKGVLNFKFCRPQYFCGCSLHHSPLWALLHTVIISSLTGCQNDSSHITHPILQDFENCHFRCIFLPSPCLVDTCGKPRISIVAVSEWSCLNLSGNHQMICIIFQFAVGFGFSDIMDRKSVDFEASCSKDASSDSLGSDSKSSSLNSKLGQESVSFVYTQHFCCVVIYLVPFFYDPQSMKSVSVQLIFFPIIQTDQNPDSMRIVLLPLLAVVPMCLSSIFLYVLLHVKHDCCLYIRPRILSTHMPKVLKFDVDFSLWKFQFISSVYICILVHGCPQASSGKVSYTSASTASIGNVMAMATTDKLRSKVSGSFLLCFKSIAC